MTELDHEQFEGAKELAEINVQIAAGRALLSTLETTTDEFLSEREKQALERIKQTLVDSEDLIRAIGKNHDALVGYRREVDGFVTDLRYLIECVTGWKAALDTYNKTENEELDKKRAEIKALLEQEQKESALLEGKRETTRLERKNLSDQARKIKDEWAALERAAKEIKDK